MDRAILQDIKYDERGLVPAITQDCRTEEVLMLAYMNRESIELTLDTGKAHYYSRSRQKLWLKGETSGHFQHVRSISIDCDGDTLLLKVEQTGAACHTGHHSCFFRKAEVGSSAEKPSESIAAKDAAGSAADLNESSDKKEQPAGQSEIGPEVLTELFGVITDRKTNPKEGSYTNYLFSKGMDKILKKVGEEASEVIIAAKNKEPGELKGEVADLLYHLLVLLAERDMTLEDVYGELSDRK
ncbi:MAG: bifunctional phosphoribosyl-AMP cyclohydrolase/phosphoribosyl-ATP diphosphatase HisIE [Clostridiales bacterium]|nr:bifunctional phosphoribosyl-AMP cyclohydrolase/phosphoribosyl-ATP diphosphatase HisIE [Clostridiales bacterium]